MRAKLTILMCALLVLALGASQAYAQEGYLVSRSITTVVEHGKNQLMGEIELEFTDSGGNIDAGNTITITFGDLSISNIFATDDTADHITQTGVSGVTAKAENDEDTNVGTVTIEIPANVGDGNTIRLTGVRTDISSLSAGDDIIGTISSSAPTGLIPIGQSRSATVSAVVAEVKGGLAVGITAASRLICNISDDAGVDELIGTDDDTDPLGGTPAITVMEGFDSAWEGDAALGGTSITIKTLNLPPGVTLRWPQSMDYMNPADDNNDTWSTVTLVTVEAEAGGSGQNDENLGDEVVYNYTISSQGSTVVQGRTNVAAQVESFELEPTVIIDTEKVGAGGIADIWAFLSPPPADKDADVGTVLSYVMNIVTDPKAGDSPRGAILNFTECVTYLLFPFLTCGAHDDWTTSIAIANTTMDDGVFGLSDGATAQSGSIMLHIFPRSMMGDDGMMMRGDPDVKMLAHDLAAGDTYSGVCDSFAPGFEGYAIAKAGFRHAHGVAYVLGNFAGGASRDVAHGYLALVIPDPEFGEGRAPIDGETLGQ